MELNRAVGENIKRIRKTKKLSMERTAEMAGVSRSMLGQIERGEANPSVAILGRIAKALKVPAEVLLENDDFQAVLLSREVDNKAKRLDAGKILLRPSFPYDDRTRLESFFLDLCPRLRVPRHGDLRHGEPGGGRRAPPAHGAGRPALSRRPALQH